jgi:CO/xanthine dehydrogenase Mo-binding subunit
MTEFKSIGKPTPLIDGPQKVTGRMQYAPDIKLAGALHARFVPSVYAHANIRGIDTGEALAEQGVVAVLTADDLPDIAPSSRERLLLARGRVMFVGQPVALVLAESEAAASDGANKVMVDYEPLPSVTTIDTAMAEDAPLVWENGVPSGSDDAGAHGADVGGGGETSTKPTNIADESTLEAGDVDAAFAEADVIVERTFTTPMAHQNSLETHGIIAQPDPVFNKMTVWSSTQSPFGVRQSVAEVLGIDESDVRVIGTTVGGGFGGKFGLYETLVAAAAQAIGRPVKLILTRSEELSAGNPAPPIRIYAKLGAKSDGTLTAIETQVFLDAGCYPVSLSGFTAFMIGSFYPVANYRLQATEVLTFKQSTGAYRAPGAPMAVLAVDTLMDELAEKLGIDPIELRLKNAAQGGDLLPNKKPWPQMGMRQVLETVRDHPVWKNRDEAKRKGRGVGVSVGGWMGGVEPSAAVCKLNRDGTVHIHVGSADLTGTTTGFALLAAETFGVDPDRIRVITSDTDTAPYAGGSGGSKVTYTTGAAVMRAAAEARQQTLAIAAEEFEASADDLEIVDGKVQVKGSPNKTLELREIASKAMRFGGKYMPVFAQGRTAITDQSPAFSAQLAEVEVDEETGEVHLHKLIVAQDVGRAINPMAVEGQMMGGATQGIGWALYEHMEYDDQGQLLSGSWMDYAVPDFTQSAPHLEAVIVENPSEAGPYGVRGVGEPPVIPTPAAIVNAVAHATGVRMSDIPLTPPKVLAALRNGR